MAKDSLPNFVAFTNTVFVTNGFTLTNTIVKFVTNSNAAVPAEATDLPGK